MSTQLCAEADSTFSAGVHVGGRPELLASHHKLPLQARKGVCFRVDEAEVGIPHCSVHL